MNKDDDNRLMSLPPKGLSLLEKKRRQYLLGSVASVALGIACLGVASSMLFSKPPEYATGEENLDAILPYSQIETAGDPRIKRVMRLMRRTPTGEYLYQYAAGQDFRFAWNTEIDDGNGSYKDGLIKESPRLESDQSLALTGVHEIRHGWQMRLLQRMPYKTDPITEWQLSIVIEADSCAYTAHYAAEYKDITGVDLTKNFSGYGAKTAKTYVRTPEIQRDFFLHAVLPCFEEIKNYPSYDKLAKKRAAIVTNMVDIVAAISLNRIMIAENGGSPYDPGFFRKDIASPSAKEKAALFSQFFSLDMGGGKPLPRLQNLSQNPDEFLTWLDRTTLKDTFDLAVVHLQQQHYYRVRDIILEHEATLDPSLYSPGTYPPAL
ncbi:MAG: hypothetical protein HYS17_10585 [Micavibrio aeruginosavorus]|uniref:Uncharacterized protein n=1 Tax=Micavibrio aeruginosavorus TaxID=349221 RepID=A0A7T5R1Q3_9BACT|nr:MAG: hypothetical protein HYS17_10585 [Micavibrio aeruginosavorus]